MTKTKKIETRRLTISAVMIALSAALSMVRVFEAPFGGSITLLSMLPVCTIAICYGTKWGLTCSFLYAFVQIALDLGKLMGYGMTVSIWVGCLVFDYLIAFGPCGTIFKKGNLWYLRRNFHLAFGAIYISFYFWRYFVRRVCAGRVECLFLFPLL